MAARKTERGAWNTLSESNKKKLARRLTTVSSPYRMGQRAGGMVLQSAYDHSGGKKGADFPTTKEVLNRNPKRTQTEYNKMFGTKKKK